MKYYKGNHIKIAIVVGSKGVNATGLIRSLGEAGFMVTFASKNSRIESKYTNAYLRLPDEPEKQVLVLLDYIKTLPTKPALYSVDDSSNFLLDDYWMDFKDVSYCPNAGGKLRIISDKTVMAQLATQAGLKIAQYKKVFLTECDEVDCPFELPVIIKPFSGYAGNKGDICVCWTREEYVSSMVSLRNKNYSAVMIQKYINEDSQYEIGIMGCSLPNGNIEIPCSIKKIRSYPSGRGSTSFAQIQNGFCGVEVDKLKYFVRATGYVGLFDIEMIVANGVPFFIEINYRNGQYGYAFTTAGYNIPSNWYKGMIGETVETGVRMREIYYINERDDYCHVKTGNISKNQWKRDFLMSEAHGMYCHGDQWPFIRQYLKIPDRFKIFAKHIKVRARDFFVREEWVIAIRPIDKNKLYEKGGTVAPFRIVTNSFRFWCADPFIISRGEKEYLFFELFDRFKGKGAIGYRVIDPLGKIGPIKVAYETSKHLSFPYVFSHKGKYYLMPESSYNRELCLLEAISFPDKWKKVGCWFELERNCDSVVFCAEDNVFLLTQPVDDTYTHSILNMFYWKDDSWHPYKNNPVVKDDSRARMAGAVINNNGTLIRPSQDCSKEHYGQAISFMKITSISKDVYFEECISRITPDCIVLKKAQKVCGIHTYNLSNRFEVIDLKLKERVQIGYLISGLKKRK